MCKKNVHQPFAQRLLIILVLIIIIIIIITIIKKELEKIEKYQMLREEIRRLWQVSNVTVIPVVVGALGVISDKFERYIKKLDVKIAMEVIQKTALLGTAMLLRKVLSL